MAVVQPVLPLPDSQAGETQVITACAGSSNEKGSSCIVQQEQQPVCDRTPHSGSTPTTSGKDNQSSGSSRKGTITTESSSTAMGEGTATAGPPEAEASSVRGARPLSKSSGLKARACVGSNQQKITFGSSSNAVRKSGIRSKLTDVLSSAASSSSSSQPVGGGLPSSNKRTTAATTVAENAKHSLVCSLLMPDGVTVRKPPPLGIASGDPVGTHILRKRATSMRTENFSSSGLNLSLHRRAAANNSMLSWQRSFRSASRGNASSVLSSSSTYGSLLSNRRARGTSFMGRPIETLPRLMAFSPSLSKALNQQAYLIPAPARVDPEEAAAVAAAAVPASADDASLTAVPAADAARRSHAAVEVCPSAGGVIPDVGGISVLGIRAQAGLAQDMKGEKTSIATNTARVSSEGAPVGGSSEVTAEVPQEEKRAPEGVGSTRGEELGVFHVDESLTASYCVDSSSSRLSFSSSIDSSSALSAVRRRAGSSGGGKIVKAIQHRYTDLKHPTDISSDTTVAAASRGSSSSGSESSSEDHVTGSEDVGTSSTRSHARPRKVEKDPSENPPAEEIQLSKSYSDDAATVEGVAVHASKSSDFRAPLSTSSSPATKQRDASSVTSPTKDASAVLTCVEKPRSQEKAQAFQSPLSPAQLYQMGITKFTEGRTPEAIEAITQYLRDAVAQKRRQRMGERSDISPSQQCKLRVATKETSGEQRTGEKFVPSPSPAGENSSMSVREATTGENQQRGGENEKSSLLRVATAGRAAEEGVTQAEVAEDQSASRCVLFGDLISLPSSPLEVATVDKDKSVGAKPVDSAPGGELPGTLPLKESELSHVTCRETDQQQNRQKPQRPMQDDQRIEEDKASGEGDGSADERDAREGIAVTRDEEQFGPPASVMPCPGLQQQGEGRKFQGKATCEEFTAGTAPDVHVDSTTTATLTADGASSQTVAVLAAAAETTTVAAGGVPQGGARADAANEEVKTQHVCSSAGVPIETSVSSPLAASSIHLDPSGKEVGHTKEHTDGGSKTTGDDNGDPAIFKAQEAVPIQMLYGVVLGRRLQIDRRAKDVIAGWGTPQYLQLEKLLGHLLFEEGDYLEAIRHYWRCIDLRPDDSQLYTNLGLAYYELGATEEAAASFEQALRYNERNTVALSVLAMLLLDEFENAEEELSQKEAEATGEGEVDRDETHRLTRLREGTDRCVKLLKCCLEVEGDNMLSVLHLAQVYMYREEWDEAEAIFKALLQDNADDTHLLNNMGQIAMNKGAMQEALQLFERVLQINPQDEVAHMHMCEALCTLQHLGRALQHFCLCCEASPDSVSLHATCGLPLCEAGKEKEVVAAYTNFIKKHPESVAAKTFKRSLGSAGDQVGFLESSQIIMFIVLPILLLIILLIGFTHLISYWSSPADDRELPPSWESIYYGSPPDKSA